MELTRFDALVQWVSLTLHRTRELRNNPRLQAMPETLAESSQAREVFRTHLKTPAKLREDIAAARAGLDEIEAVAARIKRLPNP